MATYTQQRYLFMVTDPVHIGAGGHRLGRVDNSIVREPGTDLPKIPGTSLHGAARSYAAYLYGTPDAAGQKVENIDKPDKNPICYTFGYLKGNRMASGVVSIFDAHILFFPVRSLHGPVWVSTPSRLKEAGFTAEGVPHDWESQAEAPALAAWQAESPFNLGWLMVTPAGQVGVKAPEKWRSSSPWETIKERIVLVPERLFPVIVNSNLEVRTSVAINPHTGAAEEGALFTYEAIPRSTFLTADVVLDDYRANNPDKKRPFPVKTTKQGEPLPGGPWDTPLEVVRAGLRTMEYLGVGGMGTRGFGRLKTVGEPFIPKPAEESRQ